MIQTDDRRRFGIGARAAATPATANACHGVLWNSHATMDIYVRQITTARLTTVGSEANYAQRVSARGTPAGGAFVADIDNDFERLAAPISGTLLDVAAYSVEPTRSGSAWFRLMTSQPLVGPTQELYFDGDGLRIPASTGLGVFQVAATATRFDLSFIWDE
jgi:hypothetical protein